MEQGITILLVEDNPDDAELFQHVFKRLKHSNLLKVVDDPESALNYLRGAEKYSDRGQYPFPSVILVSVRTPENGGFQVLEWLRRHPECNVIPVIIFASPIRDEDVKKAFALGVHGFFQKPASLDQLQEDLAEIYRYWSRSAKPKMPPGC